MAWELNFSSTFGVSSAHLPMVLGCFSKSIILIYF